MLSHFQSGQSFLRNLEDRRRFLAHIRFGMMVTCLKQFSALLVAQGDVESFGHGGAFLEQTGVLVILPHAIRYYQINLLMCIIGPYRCPEYFVKCHYREVREARN